MGRSANKRIFCLVKKTRFPVILVIVHFERFLLYSKLISSTGAHYSQVSFFSTYIGRLSCRLCWYVSRCSIRKALWIPSQREWKPSTNGYQAGTANRKAEKHYQKYSVVSLFNICKLLTTVSEMAIQLIHDMRKVHRLNRVCQLSELHLRREMCHRHPLKLLDQRDARRVFA